MIKKAFILRIITSFTLITFTWTTIAWSSPDSVYRIRIPKELGEVKERWAGKSGWGIVGSGLGRVHSECGMVNSGSKKDLPSPIHHSPSTNHPLIIHIQDAHNSLEAQKNIAAIIDHLTKNYGVEIVGLEGTKGVVPLDVVRSHPDPAIREAAAGYFLRQGKLCGAEYQAVSSVNPFELYGVEDADLYFRNFEAMLDVREVQGKVLEEIARFEKILERLRCKTYNAQLQDFDATWKAFLEKKISAGPWIRKLVQNACALGFEPTDYPQIQLFLDSVRKDQLSSLVEGSKLLEECDALRFACEERMAERAAEKQLVQISQRMEVVRKLVSLKAQGSDVRYFFKNKAGFEPHVLLEIIPSQERSAFHVDLWQRALRKAEDFYTAAELRNSALAGNLLGRLEKKSVERRADSVERKVLNAPRSTLNANPSVLVAGGYHTPGLTEYLREHNVPYLVITPQLSEVGSNPPTFHPTLWSKTDLDRFVETQISSLPENLRPLSPLLSPFLLQRLARDHEERGESEFSLEVVLIASLLDLAKGLKQGKVPQISSDEIRKRIQILEEQGLKIDPQIKATIQQHTLAFYRKLAAIVKEDRELARPRYRGIALEALIEEFQHLVLVDAKTLEGVKEILYGTDLNGGKNKSRRPARLDLRQKRRLIRDTELRLRQAVGGIDPASLRLCRFRSLDEETQKQVIHMIQASSRLHYLLRPGAHHQIEFLERHRNLGSPRPARHFHSPAFHIQSHRDHLAQEESARRPIWVVLSGDGVVDGIVFARIHDRMAPDMDGKWGEVFISLMYMKKTLRRNPAVVSYFCRALCEQLKAELSGRVPLQYEIVFAESAWSWILPGTPKQRSDQLFSLLEQLKGEGKMKGAEIEKIEFKTFQPKEGEPLKRIHVSLRLPANPEEEAVQKKIAQTKSQKAVTIGSNSRSYRVRSWFNSYVETVKAVGNPFKRRKKQADETADHLLGQRQTKTQYEETLLKSLEELVKANELGPDDSKYVNNEDLGHTFKNVRAAVREKQQNGMPIFTEKFMKEFRQLDKQVRQPHFFSQWAAPLSKLPAGFFMFLESKQLIEWKQQLLQGGMAWAQKLQEWNEMPASTGTIEIVCAVGLVLTGLFIVIWVMLEISKWRLSRKEDRLRQTGSVEAEPREKRGIVSPQPDLIELSDAVDRCIEVWHSEKERLEGKSQSPPMHLDPNDVETIKAAVSNFKPGDPLSAQDKKMWRLIVHPFLDDPGFGEFLFGRKFEGVILPRVQNIQNHVHPKRNGTGLGKAALIGIVTIAALAVTGCTSIAPISIDPTRAVVGAVQTNVELATSQAAQLFLGLSPSVWWSIIVGFWVASWIIAFYAMYRSSRAGGDKGRRLFFKRALAWSAGAVAAAIATKWYLRYVKELITTPRPPEPVEGTELPLPPSEEPGSLEYTFRLFGISESPALRYDAEKRCYVYEVAKFLDRDRAKQYRNELQRYTNKFHDAEVSVARRENIPVDGRLAEAWVVTMSIPNFRAIYDIVAEASGQIKAEHIIAKDIVESLLTHFHPLTGAITTSKSYARGRAQLIYDQVLPEIERMKNEVKAVEKEIKELKERMGVLQSKPRLVAREQSDLAAARTLLDELQNDESFQRRRRLLALIPDELYKLPFEEQRFYFDWVEANNILLGAVYLALEVDRFTKLAQAGETRSSISPVVLGWAAYNRGPGAIKGVLERVQEWLGNPKTQKLRQKLGVQAPLYRFLGDSSLAQDEEEGLRYIVRNMAAYEVLEGEGASANIDAPLRAVILNPSDVYSLPLNTRKEFDGFSKWFREKLAERMKRLKERQRYEHRRAVRRERSREMTRRFLLFGREKAAREQFVEETDNQLNQILFNATAVVGALLGLRFRKQIAGAIERVLGVSVPARRPAPALATQQAAVRRPAVRPVRWEVQRIPRRPWIVPTEKRAGQFAWAGVSALAAGAAWLVRETSSILVRFARWGTIGLAAGIAWLVRRLVESLSRKPGLVDYGKLRVQFEELYEALGLTYRDAPTLPALESSSFFLVTPRRWAKEESLPEDLIAARAMPTERLEDLLTERFNSMLDILVDHLKRELLLNHLDDGRFRSFVNTLITAQFGNAYFLGLFYESKQRVDLIEFRFRRGMDELFSYEWDPDRRSRIFNINLPALLALQNPFQKKNPEKITRHLELALAAGLFGHNPHGTAWDERQFTRALKMLIERSPDIPDDERTVLLKAFPSFLFTTVGPDYRAIMGDIVAERAQKSPDIGPIAFGDDEITEVDWPIVERLLKASEDQTTQMDKNLIQGLGGFLAGEFSWPADPTLKPKLISMLPQLHVHLVPTKKDSLFFELGDGRAAVAFRTKAADGSYHIFLSKRFAQYLSPFDENDRAKFPRRLCAVLTHDLVELAGYPHSYAKQVHRQVHKGLDALYYFARVGILADLRAAQAERKKASTPVSLLVDGDVWVTDRVNSFNLEGFMQMQAVAERTDVSIEIIGTAEHIRSLKEQFQLGRVRGVKLVGLKKPEVAGYWRKKLSEENAHQGVILHQGNREIRQLLASAFPGTPVLLFNPDEPVVRRDRSVQVKDHLVTVEITQESFVQAANELIQQVIDGRSGLVGMPSEDGFFYRTLSRTVPIPSSVYAALQEAQHKKKFDFAA